MDRAAVAQVLLDGKPFITTDRIWALVLILITLPLFFICTLAIWCEDGNKPILFRQARLGKNKSMITVLKFRTMVPGEKIVTGVGRWLRKSHLDELPQLWNILRGDMKFLGPRPLTPEDCAAWRIMFGRRFDERFELEPGLIGPEQILGREKQQRHTAACAILLKRQLRRNPGVRKILLQARYAFLALLCACKLQGSST